MKLPFCKYHGAGNDFILIDNRLGKYDLSEDQIAKLCHRRFGIGADGLMRLGIGYEPFGFTMQYYNADGREGTMCGNGGRCLVAFAHRLGIKNLQFRAIDGAHTASILKKEGNITTVRLQMIDINTLIKYDTASYVLNSGSPHLVRFVYKLEEVDVAKEGHFWRNHPDFKPQGLNVNFVEVKKDGSLAIFTYERGVEAETWACGTGATASAVAAAVFKNSNTPHWEVQTLGGLLSVDFTRKGDTFSDVFLSGPACFICEGEAEI